jgi:hypothetical protein
MSKRNKMIVSAIMGIGIVGGLIISPYVLVTGVTGLITFCLSWIIYCVLTEFFD